MAAVTTYDSVVAARTRAASQILTTADLLASYVSKGGLADDLTQIRDLGQQAEALSQAQSASQAAGGAATLEVLGAFTALQRDYSGVMAVVQAVRSDLVKGNAPGEVIKTIDRILVNEAEVAIKTVTSADGATKKKVAVKRASQEALRAEIARDARALITLPAAHAALNNRKVDQARLDKLLADAESLSGKLSSRAVAKGGEKQATQALHDAVSAQKQVWGASYRLLALVAHEDTRVAQLLAEAARKRSPGKKKAKG